MTAQLLVSTSIIHAHGITTSMCVYKCTDVHTRGGGGACLHAVALPSLRNLPVTFFFFFLHI